MAENNQFSEKYAAKELNNESSAQQGRDFLSQEAISEAIKNSQALGTAGRDIAAGAAAGASAGKDMLPNIIMHEGAQAESSSSAKNGKAYSDGKNAYVDDGKAGGSKGGNSPMSGGDHLYDKMDGISNQIKDSKYNPEELGNIIKNILKVREGVEKLDTGDHLVREDGRQSLFTPNGDRITVNTDGTHVIKGDVSKVSTSKDGVTTVQFGDGATVTFDRDGFIDVSRGKQSVSLRFDHKSVDPHPWPGPKPWPEPHPWPGPKPLPEPYPFPGMPTEPKPFPPRVKPFREFPEDIKAVPRYQRDMDNLKH